MIPGTNENAAKYPASDSQDTRRPVRFNLNSFAEIYILNVINC